eukprot:gene4471-809_t
MRCFLYTKRVCSAFAWFSVAPSCAHVRAHARESRAHARESRLTQTLQDLDKQLEGLGLRLFVARGRPADVFPKLIQDWKVNQEVDTEPYARVRDIEIASIVKSHGASVSTEVSHTLYDVNAVLAAAKGKFPTAYRSFQDLVSRLPPPPPPISCPKARADIHCMYFGPEYAVPSVSELREKGARIPDPSPSLLYPGGETEALKRFEHYMKKQDWVCNFEKPMTPPNSLQPSTTVLSPYLKFGCLSPRLFWSRLNEDWLSMDRCGDDPAARGRLDSPLSQGQAVFEEYLLDADYSLNAANWMWLSCSAFFSQVYSPVAFGKKTDPEGHYIRKYVPKLKKMPTKYIYEPWNAPIEVQRSAGCIVGKDYPNRIVDHDKIHKINIQRMSAAYKAIKAGGASTSAEKAFSSDINLKSDGSPAVSSIGSASASQKQDASSTQKKAAAKKTTRDQSSSSDIRKFARKK